MQYNHISNWVRQARHRAKKHSTHNDLKLEDVERVIDIYNGKCALCEDTATKIDHLFPLSDGAPNIVANVMPICDKCKRQKGNKDVMWLYHESMISKPTYTTIIKNAVKFDGMEILANYIRSMIG